MSLRAQRADELISVSLGLESQNEKNNCPLPAFAYPFMLPVGFYAARRFSPTGPFRQAEKIMK